VRSKIDGFFLKQISANGISVKLMYILLWITCPWSGIKSPTAICSQPKFLKNIYTVSFFKRNVEAKSARQISGFSFVD